MGTKECGELENDMAKSADMAEIHGLPASGSVFAELDNSDCPAYIQCLPCSNPAEEKMADMFDPPASSSGFAELDNCDSDAAGIQFLPCSNPAEEKMAEMHGPPVCAESENCECAGCICGRACLRTPDRHFMDRTMDFPKEGSTEGIYQ